MISYSPETGKHVEKLVYLQNRDLVLDSERNNHKVKNSAVINSENNVMVRHNTDNPSSKRSLEPKVRHHRNNSNKHENAINLKKEAELRYLKEKYF